MTLGWILLPGVMKGLVLVPMYSSTYQSQNCSFYSWLCPPTDMSFGGCFVLLGLFSLFTTSPEVTLKTGWNVDRFSRSFCLHFLLYFRADYSQKTHVSWVIGWQRFHERFSHTFPVIQFVSSSCNWMWKPGSLWRTLAHWAHSSGGSQALVSSASCESLMLH